MPIITKKKFLSFCKKIFIWVAGALILTIITVAIFKPLEKLFRGPKEYYIYIVSNFTDETAKNIRDKFEGTFDTTLEIDGVEIVTKRENDYGDPSKAQTIASDIAERDNTLMVVGHFYSNTTAKALPEYMSADPQIPVILTTETNPHLLPSNNYNNIPLKEYQPIYCLSPDDYNQAKTAAEHATSEKENQNFWVVQDVDNKVYSNFLSINFIEKVQEKKDKKVLLLTDNTLILSAETLKAFEIDCIFFAGHWRNALILIHQINTIYKNITKPKIILSDGCVDNRLIKQGKDAVEGVFLTHQKKQEYFRKEGGWGIYGIDAAKVVKEIIRDTNATFKKGRLKKWFGIHRVNDARNAIKNAMYKKFGGKYRRDDIFHIWKITRDDQGHLMKDFY